MTCYDYKLTGNSSKSCAKEVKLTVLGMLERGEGVLVLRICGEAPSGRLGLTGVLSLFRAMKEKPRNISFECALTGAPGESN